MFVNVEDEAPNTVDMRVYNLEAIEMMWFPYLGQEVDGNCSGTSKTYNIKDTNMKWSVRRPAV